MTPPIDLRPDHAKIVHDIIARHLPGGVSVRVFGSRAKWTAKPHSDLDLAVKGKGPLPRAVLSDVAEAFSESDLPFRVDVVDWHSVAPSFQAVIDRDGKALGWPLVTLGDVASELTVGHVGSMANEYVATGIPFLRSLNIEPYRISLQDLKFISPEFHKRLRKSALKPGDVVIIRTGKPGVCSVIPEWLTDANCSDLVIVRCGNDLHPRYLAYWVNSLAAHHIGSNLVGAVQQHFNVGSARQMPISLPPLDEQERILSVLATIDDKIELNRRMNATLERQAQAVFRDWFVDFGPVRRKQAGEVDPVAILGGLTPDPTYTTHLAALFPDAFGDDGLPMGWSARPLDSIAEFLNGLALQKHPPIPGEPDLPVIKIAELRNGLTERSNRASRTLPPKYIVRDGDFIFSWSGSLMAKVWTEGDGALNQHLFKVTSATYPQWFYALWVHHHMPEFQLIAASKATTMGHIQRMHLTNAVTVCPPGPSITAMSEVMQPLWDRMIHCELENRTLAETRDYLLPRLMSGTVRVVPQDRAA
ncbi:restriction endonuclease subunit S [Sphingobium sp. AR-3-1]|uniref:Restriction endonuclease subunit S n=1 Tax=Sphingobium psychrophilum TaxID=2728834 RepID=A0A7X9WSN8_9SPHN|nr:restriction endonuclease subunit S [Sphingobium psychrophilum]NML09201.1 restriction endonuclease subunit S [Sphingobium psychrophilum]